ncbi:MAG: hypothetical protein LBU90_02660 [Bacteroidales bacterium]|jgi:hypothetical protein|nr:hypothetical protein [Bacteroidales bacterium]
METKFEQELGNYKQSWQYPLSKIVAVFAAVIALVCIVDYFYDNTVVQVSVPEFAAQLQMSHTNDLVSDVQVTVGDRVFRFHPQGNINGRSNVAILMGANTISAYSTRWFGQAKYLSVDTNTQKIRHANIYNDGFVLWVALLLLPLVIFLLFSFRSALVELLFTRYYTLIVLPFILIFVLFGGQGWGRLAHAINVLF